MTTFYPLCVRCASALHRSPFLRGGEQCLTTPFISDTPNGPRGYGLHTEAVEGPGAYASSLTRAPGVAERFEVKKHCTILPFETLYHVPPLTVWGHFVTDPYLASFGVWPTAVWTNSTAPYSEYCDTPYGNPGMSVSR